MTSREIEFAQPREVHDLAECFFYHVMDLPGVGTVGEQWDLRTTINEYLGGFDFRGKRVLDVGSASGFLTFEMEKRGADVVSFDLADGADWDIVPHHALGGDLAAAARAKRENIRRLTNAYWYAHRVLGSRAHAYYGDIYHIPDALGPFDVVVLGSILLHVRDPMLGLWSASRVARDAMIITDFTFDSPEAVMRFVPDPNAPGSVDTWWMISEACMTRMLEMLGFRIESITRHRHLAVKNTERWLQFSTYVARRQTGTPIKRGGGVTPAGVSSSFQRLLHVGEILLRRVRRLLVDKRSDQAL